MYSTLAWAKSSPESEFSKIEVERNVLIEEFVAAERNVLPNALIWNKVYIPLRL